jgi:type IV secretion system protein VirB1
VNRANWPRYGLTLETAFDPCHSLAAGASVLQRCFEQALARQTDVQQALRASLSCYASGDFRTGYRTGYVQRVVDSVPVHPIPTVPAIEPPATPIPVVPLGNDAPPVPGKKRATRPMVPESARKQERQLDRGRDPPDGSAVVF